MLDFKPPKMPDFEIRTPKAITFSTEQIKSMTDDEIIASINGDIGDGELISTSTLSTLSSEILSRNIKQSSKPHWTVLPTFIMVLVSVILSASVAYKEFFQLQPIAAVSQAPLSEGQYKKQQQESSERPVTDKSKSVSSQESQHAAP